MKKLCALIFFSLFSINGLVVSSAPPKRPSAKAEPQGMHKRDFMLQQFPGDTLYFNSQQYRVMHAEMAQEYMLTRSIGPGRFMQLSFSMEGVLLEQVHYLRRTPYQNDLEGPYRKWNLQGELIFEAFYEQNKLHGPLITFWDGWQIRRREEYQQGRLVRGSCFDEQGGELAHFPLFVPAAFPGGEEARQHFFSRQLTYPPRAVALAESGYVLVEFVVDKEGMVGQARLLRGVSPDLDQEALKAIEAMPRWIPARFDGETCETWLVMPLHFKLL